MQGALTLNAKPNSIAIVPLSMLAISWQAKANLIVDTTVTSTFAPGTATTDTFGNDLPGHPDSLYLGQLRATSDGAVKFWYVGNEAGYVNSLRIDGDNQLHSTNNTPDVFTAPYLYIGSVGVTSGGMVDFGFCTSGDAALPIYGRCVSNNDASSVTAQFNYNGVEGYRSIGYRQLTSFDPATGSFSYGSGLEQSNLWMLFWDDAGAANDDNHDDYIAVAYFRPVGVPEPAPVLLLGMGLLAIVATRRLQANRA
jgi:hypothetical protein